MKKETLAPKTDKAKIAATSHSEIVNDPLFLSLQKSLSSLSKKYDISSDVLIHLLKEKNSNKFTIPISLFQNRSLGVLEVVVKFLKEEKDISYHAIALLLKRDDRTIWATYNFAKKKVPERFSTPIHSAAAFDFSSKIFVSIEIFSDRRIGCLESLVLCLKAQGYSFHQIAGMLNRDDRTIWTSHNKAISKIESKGDNLST